MKVGILSESDADEAGIKILAQAVLAAPLEIIQPVRIRSRGWPAVLNNLPAIYQALHWNPYADGLIVVIDSDETQVHDQSHEDAGFANTDCRYCEINRIVLRLQGHISPLPQPPLKIAIGLAVPAIEAWYQCGVDVHSTEPRFSREKRERLYDLRRDLKRQSYGLVSAPQTLMKQRAIEHCRRLAQNFPLLEQNFPNGFGLLAASLRRW